MWDAILGDASGLLRQFSGLRFKPYYDPEVGSWMGEGQTLISEQQARQMMDAWGSEGLGDQFGVGDGANSEFVTIDGKEYARVGHSADDFAREGGPVIFDPRYGNLVPADFYRSEQAKQRERNASEFDIGKAGVFGLGLAGVGYGLGPGFAGFSEMGTAIPGVTEGTSLFGQLTGGDAPWGVNPRDAAAMDDIQRIELLDRIGGGQGATAGATMLGFGSVPEAVSALAPAWSSAVTSALRGIPLSTLVSGAGNIGGALLSSGASRDAAGIQADSAREAAGVQRYMFDTTRADLQPWMKQGGIALGRIGELLGISGDPNSQGYGSLMKQFSSADLNADPIYGASKDFQLDETRRALTHAASARGELDSGVLLKDLLKYGTGILSGTGTDAFNRFNANRTTAYNMLAPTANLGQATGVQLGQVGQQAGQVIGQNITGAGNAEAAGRVGGANAISGGISNALQAWQNQQLLDRFLPRGSSVMAE